VTVPDFSGRPADGTFSLWWLGQSGFAIRHSDEMAVVDPYLSDSLTRKYAGTAQPHVRMRPIAIEPQRLAEAGITVISASHQHTDHMDPETLTPIVARSRELGLTVRLVAPEAWRSLAVERSGLAGEDVIGMDDGITARVGSFSFTGVPSAHPEVDRDRSGHCKFMGYVIRFGRWAVYHSGDTLWHDGLAERLRPIDVDVALLPINGKVGNMSGTAAARLAAAIGAKVVIPCHYDMFEFNTASPGDEFVPECERIGQSYRVLELGELYAG
jgi:L-ascorbate metabolism protein UlaG (beta-lactamase superfamily)